MACPTMDTGPMVLRERSASRSFPGLTAHDIVHAIESRTDRDTHNSWLTRAYEAMDGSIDPDFLQEVEKRLQIVKDDISPLLKRAEVTLWRGSSQRPLGTMGIHWTCDRGVAERNGPYLARAAVPETAIDWPGTAFRRISWPTEQEITLRPGAKILVTDLEPGGKRFGAGRWVTIALARPPADRAEKNASGDFQNISFLSPPL